MFLKNLFIELFCTLCVVFIFSGCSSSFKNTNNFPTHPLAIVQGSTDKVETFISILSYKKQGPLSYFYRVDEKGVKKKRVLSFLKKSSPDTSRVVEQIHICLLYTSPSPRDQRGSRMPSSA